MKNRNIIIGWILLLAAVFMGGMITVYEDFNMVFISMQILLLAFVVIYRKSFTPAQISIARVLMAAVFIFSGFVKGVDPLGTQYRIEDYFSAFGTDWAKPFALILSVLLNAFEFILGVMLLFNIHLRSTIWVTGLVMALFTIITLNDALYEPVPDCGCFGDALIISNWQTLYKNLVIDALFLLVFFSRKKIKPWLYPGMEWGIAFLFAFVFIGFEIYNIRHLPVIDFSDWKRGNRMAHENPQPKQFYLTYRNINSGQEEEFLSPNYPYNDTIWMTEWEFVRQRVVDPNPPLHELSIDDEFGGNHNSAVIENPGYQFILVSHDLKKMSLKKIDEIRSFIESCVSHDVSFVVVTASLPEVAEEFRINHDLDAEFYFADDVNLKSMIRSNPGLVLLKNAVVMNKWHFNDFPDYNDFMNDYSLNSGID